MNGTMKRLAGLLAAAGGVTAALFLLISWAGAAGTAAPSQNAAAAVGTGFTYQGRLENNGSPVNGTCDLQFALYDAASGGSQVGATITKNNVTVNDGLFTTELDFGGGAFDGNARWLQISVRCPAGSGSYTSLSGRAALNPSPYAVYAAGAPWSGLSGVPAGFADGVDDGQTYARTIIVSPSGTITDNGATLLNAINSISGATYTNTYLVKIEPGVYYIGATPLQMKSFVDVEGSGQGITAILGDGVNTTNNATVIGASASELRNLYVGTDGTGSTYAINVYYGNNGVFNLKNVTLSASGASHNYGLYQEGSGLVTVADSEISSWGDVWGGTAGNATGIRTGEGALKVYRSAVVTYGGSGKSSIGIENSAGNPATLYLKDSQIVAGGSGNTHTGVQFSNSSGSPSTTVEIVNTEVVAQYGASSNLALNVSSTGSVTNTIQIRNSRLSGSSYSISNTGGHNVRAAVSMLDGALYAGSGGTFSCFQVYDNSYNAVTCP